MIRRCEICGKEFEARSNRSKYCNGPHYVECPVCGKIFVAKSNDQAKRKYVTCSYECRVKKTQKTSMEKYGCKAPGNNPEAREKAKKTMIKKYGVEYTLQSKELSNQVKLTNLKRYGSENAMKNSAISQKTQITQRKKFNGKLAFNTEKSYEARKKTIEERYGSASSLGQIVRTKAAKTNIQKYGVDHPMKVPSILKKQQDSLEEHYGVRNAFKSEAIRKRAEKTMLERYGVSNASYSEELVLKADESMRKKYGKPFRFSKVNEAFKKKLDDLNIVNQQEFFLEGKWFDFYLPKTNILIEIDPVYTHNFHDNKWHSPLSKDSQLIKTEIAEKHGYKCIHVFDWDNQDKIVELFQNHKKIYARNCDLHEVPKKDANDFLEANHLQGTCRGLKYILGLYFKNNLISIIAFGNSRYDKKYDSELLRLCTKQGFKVIGGASRLFKNALKSYDLGSIISYCDRSKFTGEVYEKLGMNLIRTTPPNTIWSDGKHYITANLLQSRGFDQIFKTNYGKGTSNHDLMMEHYWRPIYDCGQAVYEWIK